MHVDSYLHEESIPSQDALFLRKKLRTIEWTINGPAFLFHVRPVQSTTALHSESMNMSDTDSHSAKVSSGTPLFTKIIGEFFLPLAMLRMENHQVASLSITG